MFGQSGRYVREARLCLLVTEKQVHGLLRVELSLLLCADRFGLFPGLERGLLASGIT